jgi:cell filamentation protein
MSEKARRDRYDTSANPEDEYVDSAQLVLKNLQGINDFRELQLAEEAALARAYEQILREVRVSTPMTCNLVCHIHKRVFGGLFVWAGKWRSVWISKPGTTWPPPDFLDQAMQSFEREVLGAYPPSALADDDRFCRAIGHIQGEFLVIHPFREGNARTIKMMTDILAIQTQRPMLRYDTSIAGADAYIEASKRAFRRDYAPLTELIRHALALARESP